MGFWKIVRDVLAVPPAVEPPSLGERASSVDRRAIAREIVSAEDSTGRSHWDIGVEVAKRHDLSVSDVHDEYMDERERQDRAQERRDNLVVVTNNDPTSLSILDIRDVPSIRMRIKGSAHWVSDAGRKKFGGIEYILVREPSNKFDPSAIAVFGRGRKVGHISASKAAALAPILDSLSYDGFLVSGTSMVDNSIRLWVDVPTLPALRQFVKGLHG